MAVRECQDTFALPDILVELVLGKVGRVIGWTRVAAGSVLYGDTEEELGSACGRIHTYRLRRGKER